MDVETDVPQVNKLTKAILIDVASIFIFAFLQAR